MNLSKIFSIIVVLLSLTTQLLGSYLNPDSRGFNLIQSLSKALDGVTACSELEFEGVLVEYSRGITSDGLALDALRVESGQEFDVLTHIKPCIAGVSVDVSDSIPSAFELVDANDFQNPQLGSLQLVLPLGPAENNTFRYTLRAPDEEGTFTIGSQGVATYISPSQQEFFQALGEPITIQIVPQEQVSPPIDPPVPPPPVIDPPLPPDFEPARQPVTNILPTAHITIDKNQPMPFEWITFDGSNSFDEDGEIVEWYWRFSDGHSANGEVVQHMFDGVGNFSATLTVRDNDQALSSSMTNNLTVIERPKPNFGLCSGRPPLAVCLGGGGFVGGVIYRILNPPIQPQPESPAHDPKDIIPTPSVAGGFVFFPHDQLLVQIPGDYSELEVLIKIRKAIGPANEIEMLGYYPEISTYLIRFPWISNKKSISARLSELERVENRINNNLHKRGFVLKNYFGTTAQTDPDIVVFCRENSANSDCDIARNSLQRVNVLKAWDLINNENSPVSNNRVTVTVIDAGVDGDHPDLASFLDSSNSDTYVLRNGAEVPWNESGISGHATGVVGPIGAANQKGGNKYNGIISGVTDNYSVIVYNTFPFVDYGEEAASNPDIIEWLRKLDRRSNSNINLEYRLERLREASEAAAAPLSSVLDSIRRSAIAGVKVINLSMEWDIGNVDSEQAEFEMGLIYEIFQQYFEHYQHEMLFISAAGNGRPTSDELNALPFRQGVELNAGQKHHAPGGVVAPNNISVAALVRNAGSLANFSNYGEGIDIAVPGERIHTLGPDGEYTLQDGTSFSAPIVSGVAALLWAINPAMSPSTVKRLLIESSHGIGSNVNLLNACEAVWRALPNPSSDFAFCE